MKRKIIFNILVTLIFITGVSARALGQTGRISGKVTDKKSGETLIGASIKIEGTTKGTATDADGNYNLGNLEAGKYTIAVGYIGFQSKKVTAEVKPGEVTTINFVLEESQTQSLNEVTITVKKNRESEVALLAERKLSTTVEQKIGSQELTRKGVSNVGEGLTKVSGVSMVGNKALFVRGLGDRYNNATLNGLPIPSTNPDVKLIPLDLFPASIVKNISVVKSYSAPLYGDFSGGTVDIVTKDYPDQPFFKVSLSSGFNSKTTGKPFMRSSEGIGSYSGFNRSNREMPDQVASLPFYNANENGGNRSPGFATSWSPQRQNAPVNQGVTIAGGNLYKFNNGKELGFLANVAFKNDYSFQDGVSALYNAQKSPRYRYATETYQYTTNTSGLFNFYFKQSEKSNYNLTFLYVNDSADGVYDNSGSQFDLGEISGRRNTYTQNTLLSTQLKGNNKFGDRTGFTWALGYANTIGSMPDRTQNTFRNVGGNFYFVTDAISYNHKFFSDLDDTELTGRFEFDFKPKNEEKTLKSTQIGFNGRYKDRTFNARQIDTKIAISENVNPNNVDATLNDSRLGDGNTAGTFNYTESYYAPNNYQADLFIAAPYINFNLEWNERLKLIAGLRVEASNQNIYYKEGSATFSAPFTKKQLQNVDFLPGATLKYNFSDNKNFLIATSKTISRPLFVEASPFRLNNAAATAEIQGNPALVNSSNYNLDFKYEMYPSNNELFAVTLFGKYIQNPIELAQVLTSDDLFSYVNTDQAYVAGIELEVNRNIASLVGSSSKTLKNMSIGFNGSYMYNQIKINPDKILSKGVSISPTNLERPLFGASPYLINLDYSYKHNWNNTANTTFTVAYNVFGKRLFVAGSQGAGDIYEMPVNTLDAIINTKLNKRVSLDLSLGNLLNPSVVYKQEYSDSPLIFSNFKRGVNVGLGLSYSF